MKTNNTAADMQKAIQEECDREEVPYEESEDRWERDEDDGRWDADSDEEPDAEEDEAECSNAEHETHNQEVGRRGECAAARFLERRGFDILERNWKCNAGEADIIARDGQALVFVEVKTRTNVDMGFPEEAVDAAKRARYEKIAAYYLKDYPVVDIPVRFDVVALLVVGSDRALVKHHVNAFSAES